MAADTDQAGLGMLDRAVRSAGVRMSRRTMFKGTLFGLGSLAVLKALTPLTAEAICENGCHYCVSGCVCSYSCMSCCADDGTCQQCCSIAGSCNYVKDYVCDYGCDHWCATGPC
jgi:hypothetical protein